MGRMALLRKLILGVSILAAGTLVPSVASADVSDPLGFHLAAAVMTVPEDVGSAVVTIERTGTSREAQIRYTTLPGTAVRSQDYTPVKSMIVFMPGQASATFSIPIVNHGMVEVPKTIRIALFGAHSTGMGVPSTAVLTIVTGAVSVLARDPGNPLGLAAPPAGGDPLTGATPSSTGRPVWPPPKRAAGVSSVRSQRRCSA
jgi:hypothetical protein